MQFQPLHPFNVGPGIEVVKPFYLSKTPNQTASVIFQSPDNLKLFFFKSTSCMYFKNCKSIDMPHIIVNLCKHRNVLLLINARWVFSKHCNKAARLDNAQLHTYTPKAINVISIQKKRLKSQIKRKLHHRPRATQPQTALILQ